jgi:hypothetical protein
MRLGSESARVGAAATVLDGPPCACHADEADHRLEARPPTACHAGEADHQLKARPPRAGHAGEADHRLRAGWAAPITTPACWSRGLSRSSATGGPTTHGGRVPKPPPHLRPAEAATAGGRRRRAQLGASRALHAQRGGMAERLHKMETGCSAPRAAPHADTTHWPHFEKSRTCPHDLRSWGTKIIGYVRPPPRPAAESHSFQHVRVRPRPPQPVMTGVTGSC